MLIKKSKEAGFSYIDVMCAIVILMVGVLAMVSALMANLVRSYESEKRVIAKQMALSTVESIIAAKEMKRIGVTDSWKTIRNIITPAPAAPEPNGIFMLGWNPVREDMGWDGVAGTIDDACPAGGPCVVAGRTTNTSPVLPGFRRRITITDIADPERPPPNEIMRRRVDVNIEYTVKRGTLTETASTILSNY